MKIDIIDFFRGINNNKKMKKIWDKFVEKLWDEFADVPINPETECIEEEFFYMKKGTPREDILHWFDEHHSKGIRYLMKRSK